MSGQANRAGASSHSSSSLLERVQPQKSLSENQSQVDGLVSHSMAEATNLNTLSAMTAGGFAFRFARAGSMAPALLSKGPFLPTLIRGGSYVVGLSAESAVFAGVGRKLNQWGGQNPTQPFTQEWAHAAITLGALKSFGGLTKGQNIILQHLATDLGVVTGQHLGYAAHLSPKPQGSFAEQMLSAEATNWHLKAGMSLVHGLAPSLLPTEKAMDLILKSQETNLKRPLPFFAQLAAEGVPGDFISKSVESEEAKKSHISAMSKEGEGGSPPTAPKGEKPVPGTDEGGLARERITDDDIRKANNAARETHSAIFTLHLLEMLGLVHQQSESRSNAVNDAEQFVRSLAGADLRRVKDLLLINVIRIVPPGPGADPRRVEDAWAALRSVELCLATLQRLDHDGLLFQGLSKDLRILGEWMTSGNPAPGTVNTLSESELSNPYPSRQDIEALRFMILKNNSLHAVAALLDATKTNPVDANWALQDLNPNGNEAERAACEALKRIDVAPLVEAIKTNPQGIYWLRNLKSAGNEAARMAVETFDAASLAERAKTDRETLLALRVLAHEGNKSAQKILVEGGFVPARDEVPSIPFQGPFPDSPLKVSDEGFITMTKYGRLICFSPKGELSITIRTPTSPGRRPESLLHTVLGTMIVDYNYFQQVLVTSEDLRQFKTAIENEIKSKPHDHRLQEAYQRLLKKFP